MQLVVIVAESRLTTSIIHLDRTEREEELV